MSHLDDGLLTALLDNELAEGERQAAESHLAACPECRRLLEEAKAIAAEADRLVASVELPPPGGAATGREAGHAPRSGRRWRNLAWAASLVAAVGLGWVASDLRYQQIASTLTAPSGQIADAAPSPVQAVSPATPTGPPASAAVRQAPVHAAPPAATVPSAGISEAAKRVARAETPASPTGATGGLVDANSPAAPARDSHLQALRANEVALDKTGRDERKSADLAAFRPATMEEAVRTLGGSIRLIDGLEPERVLIGTGSVAPGGAPSPGLVRVVYQDPPGRELLLDQQRAPDFGSASAGRSGGGGLMVGDTIHERSPDGGHRIVWIDQHGFELVLTGFLTADSLQAMILRVH